MMPTGSPQPEIEACNLSICSEIGAGDEKGPCLGVYIEELRKLRTDDQNTTDTRFFHGLLQTLAETVGASLTFVWEFDSQLRDCGKTIATWDEGQPGENFAFNLAGTPCGEAVGSGLCFITDSVGERFSLAPPLPTTAESYIGIPLLGLAGQPLGALAAYGHQPLERHDKAGWLLRAFAHKAALELERRRAISARQEREEFFRSIFENAAVGIMTMAAGGQLLTVNPAFCNFIGYSEAELLSIGATEFPHPEDLPDLQLLLREVRTGKRRSFDCEKRFLCKDGSTVWGQLTFTRLSDGQTAATSAVCLVQDITQRKQAEERANQLAYFDLLTELPNLTLLKDRLERTLGRARHRGTTGAVLFLDLDRFMGINDSLGHAAGDQLLRTVAERLNACVKADDTVARLGGDEFAIILSSLQKPENAAIVAQRILERLAAPVELAGQTITRTVSIGITLFPEDGDEVSSLLRNADLAMYQAKEQGRNNFQFYRREQQGKAVEKLLLETHLRHALPRDELSLHYQPQVETLSKRPIGIEALLRWQPAGKEPIPPGKFIPLAEETGLIIPIGDWVLQQTCAQNRAWQEAGLPPLRVAVNVSGHQFKQPDFVARVEAILAETGLAPHYLELELTESFIMKDVEQTRKTLQGLKRLGVQLAVDDFGTGYSSLNYLKNFPIDRLKIDQSFVRDISRNPNDAAITTAIIAMGHSLGMKVIAEGVETKEQLDFLRHHRCDEVQGYYFGRPMSKDDVFRFLQAGSR